MSTLWKCETPVELSHYFRRLTVWNDTVVYTKYIVNKLGMMPSNQVGAPKAVIKEYAFPPVPSFFLSPDLSPTDVISSGGSVVINSQSSGALCRWRPGRKTALYVQAKGNRIAFNGRRLGVDSKKRLWTPCSVVLSWSGPFPRVEPGLARITWRGRNAQCEYWQLPTDFVSPMGIWIDQKDRCWFSVLNSNSPPSGYSFGRLDPTTDTLDGWGIGTMVWNVHGDIAGIGEGEEVWISAHSWGNGRVHRYRIGADATEVYSHSGIQEPYDVAIDPKGNPWFACRGGQIATVIGSAVSKEPLIEQKWVTRRKQAEVTVTPVSVTPLGGSTMVAGMAMAPEQIAMPFRHFNTQLWTSSSAASPVITDKGIWFADTSAEQIGFLKV